MHSVFQKICSDIGVLESELVDIFSNEWVHEIEDSFAGVEPVSLNIRRWLMQSQIDFFDYLEQYSNLILMIKTNDIDPRYSRLLESEKPYTVLLIEHNSREEFRDSVQFPSITFSSYLNLIARLERLLNHENVAFVKRPFTSDGYEMPLIGDPRYEAFRN